MYPNISSNSWRLTRVCLCLCVCVKGGVRNKMQKVDENKKKAGFMLRGLHISLFFFFSFSTQLVCVPGHAATAPWCYLQAQQRFPFAICHQIRSIQEKENKHFQTTLSVYLLSSMPLLFIREMSVSQNGLTPVKNSIIWFDSPVSHN